MLADLKSRINVDTKYQRDNVWSRPQQALLIDSILRGFDVPKIYLGKLRDGDHHLFEVIDGKQRLAAIWSFLEDQLALLSTADEFPELGDLRGMKWSQLPGEAKDRLQFASMTVSKLEDASEDEIRDLFLRLQKGEPLKAAEKRNAVAGPVRDFVANTLARHSFWPKSGIRAARFGWHEHSAIILVLAAHAGPANLKGADLLQLYGDVGFDPDGVVAERAGRILDHLEKMADAAGSRLIRTRWGIVDLSVVLMRLWEDGRNVSPEQLATFFATFESERLKAGQELSDVQTAVVEMSVGSTEEDATIYLPSLAVDMLEYYLAFSREGARRENIVKRSEVMYQRVLKFLSGATSGA